MMYEVNADEIQQITNNPRLAAGYKPRRENLAEVKTMATILSYSAIKASTHRNILKQ